MKLFHKQTLAYFLIASLLGSVAASFLSCGNSPQPPPALIWIATHYQTSSGVDLLNPSAKGSFRKEDLKVVSKVEANGVIKDMYYGTDETGIDINVDGNGSSFIRLSIPTNVSVNPIATYVTLSASDTDTVTYTFLSTKYKYMPDKIYYNNKLVWKIEDTPPNSNWNPITVIK